MTRQITVRLPDDLVEFIDQMVQSGQAISRAAVVARAVERERRQQFAEHDAAILASAGRDPEFDQLAALGAIVPSTDLD